MPRGSKNIEFVEKKGKWVARLKKSVRAELKKKYASAWRSAGSKKTEKQIGTGLTEKELRRMR